MTEIAYGFDAPAGAVKGADGAFENAAASSFGGTGAAAAGPFPESDPRPGENGLYSEMAGPVSAENSRNAAPAFPENDPYPGENGPLPGENGEDGSLAGVEGLFPGPGGEVLAGEDARLLADPARGDTYRALRPAVLATVAFSRRAGSPVGVEDAFRAALAEEYFPMLEARSEGARAQARRAAANSAATPGPLSGPVAAPVADYAAMSGEDFSRLVARALRGELRRG